MPLAPQYGFPATVCAPKQEGPVGAQPPQHRQRSFARIWIQSVSKSFQKSIQNETKIFPNRRQNGPKSRSGRSVGLILNVFLPQGACGPLPGRLWGSSWGRFLGGSWAVSCTKLGRPRASWRTSWRNFDAKMGSSWHKSQINHESYVKFAQRLKTYIFPIYFKGF